MNTSLLSIIKRITAEQGEAVLADPQRLKAFFKQYAHNEPKDQCLAFGRCVEMGCYGEIKKARTADERRWMKTELARQVHSKTELALPLCADALDLLEAAVFTAQTQPANSAPVTPRPAQSVPQTPAASANGWTVPNELTTPDVLTFDDMADLVNQTPNETPLESLKKNKKAVMLILGLCLGGFAALAVGGYIGTAIAKTLGYSIQSSEGSIIASVAMLVCIGLYGIEVYRIWKGHKAQEAQALRKENDENGNVRCPRCKKLIDFKAQAKNARIKCPFCGHGNNYPYKLRLPAYNILLFPGKQLYPRHTVDVKDTGKEVTAGVVENTKDPLLWGLINLGGNTWRMRAPDGTVQEIAFRSVVPIIPGVTVDFGRLTGEIGV